MTKLHLIVSDNNIIELDSILDDVIIYLMDFTGGHYENYRFV
jgi:hypothetical protein